MGPTEMGDTTGINHWRNRLCPYVSPLIFLISGETTHNNIYHQLNDRIFIGETLYNQDIRGISWEGCELKWGYHEAT